MANRPGVSESTHVHHRLAKAWEVLGWPAVVLGATAGALAFPVTLGSLQVWRRFLCEVLCQGEELSQVSFDVSRIAKT